jgi:hypothetical protein
MNANYSCRRPQEYFAFSSKSFTALPLCQQDGSGHACRKQHAFQTGGHDLTDGAKASFA